ncbi:MAG: hypothetical protein ACRCVT_05900, partial [Leadbetterella sp.]
MKKLLLLLFVSLSATSFAQDITPKAVVENYIKAIGGEEALRKVTDMEMEMTGETMGQKISLNVSKKLPNKFLVSMKLDMMGEVNRSVFDGVKGKIATMGQEQILEGEKAKALEGQSEIFGELKYLQDLSQLQYGGKETVDNIECHVLKITTALGEITEFYEVSSGLKIRQKSVVESQMGSQSITADYSDYKDVNGVKFPHMLKQDMGVVKMELEVKSVKINTGLSDDIFKV